MKQTREQLVVELAQANENIKSSLDKSSLETDEYRRQEFAKAFGWYKKRTSYSYDDTGIPILPTWYEIMVEIGKLLSGQKALTYITDVEQLKLRLSEAEMRIIALQQKHED